MNNSFMDQLKENEAQIKAYEEASFEVLKNHPTIASFLNEHHLDEEYLRNNPRVFREYLKDELLCKQCQGLAFCRQKRAGERCALRYQDPLTYTEIDYCPLKMEALKKEKINRLMVYNDIPTSLSTLSLDDLTVDEDNRDFLFKLYQCLEGRIDHGYFFYGGFGLGKTYGTMALCNDVIKKGKTAAFVKVNDLVNRMRQWVIDDPSLKDDVIRMLQKADVLVLDDIGNESVSSFSRDDVLFVILDYRMENKKMTFFTSNQDLEALRIHYTYDKKLKEEHLKADRLLERIRILAQPYCLGGKNRRG